MGLHPARALSPSPVGGSQAEDASPENKTKAAGEVGDVKSDDEAKKADPEAEPEPEKKPAGPPPSGRRYYDLPVPSWFRPVSADAFHHVEMRDSDVVLSLVVKAGTTWVHTVLRALLHRFDSDGKETDCGGCRDGVGSAGQAYPDALPLDAAEREWELADPNAAFCFARDFFGDYTFQELLNQPEPRLISTRLFGPKFLPLQLLGLDSNGHPATEPGKGRLVVVLRNLKDVLVSLHYFRGPVG